MKKISIAFIALVVLFVSVSCNMDSATGLFEDAGTSAKKASYTIHNVLLRFSDSEYLVASDEGIFVFDGSQVGSSYGTGINARNVVYATGTKKDDWYCIYYDESAEKYYKIGCNIEKTEYTALSSKYKNQGTYSYEYINDAHVKAQVFINSENNKYYIFYADDSSTLLTDDALTSLSTYSYSSVAYMGNGLFTGIDSGTSYYFAHDNIDDRTKNSNNYVTHIDGVFLNKSNTFYNTSASISSISGNTYRRVATNLTNGNRYFMVRGLNYAYYVDSSNKLIETSVSGLSSIEVVFVAKVVDGNYINLITAQNGAQCISLVDKSVTSSWK